MLALISVSPGLHGWSVWLAAGSGMLPGVLALTCRCRLVHAELLGVWAVRRSGDELPLVGVELGSCPLGVTVPGRETVHFGLSRWGVTRDKVCGFDVRDLVGVTFSLPAGLLEIKIWWWRGAS